MPKCWSQSYFITFCYNRTGGFRGEVFWNSGRGRTTDGRRTNASRLYYEHPRSLWSRWANLTDFNRSLTDHLVSILIKISSCISSSYKLVYKKGIFIVQEPKGKRRGSLSFNSRVWQPCGSKYTFMLLYFLARRHFEKGTGDSKFTFCSPE